MGFDIIDKRNYPRIDFEREVMLSRGDQHSQVTVRDLSAGGVSIASDPLPRGVRVQLTFPLGANSFQKITATVVRSLEGMVGLKFVSPIHRSRLTG